MTEDVEHAVHDKPNHFFLQRQTELIGRASGCRGTHIDVSGNVASVGQAERYDIGGSVFAEFTAIQSTHARRREERHAYRS